MRAFGFICPNCGKPVYSERTPFALSAAAAGVVCACGRGKLTAEPFRGIYRVTVPCGICGGEHRAELPAEKFLRGSGVGLACPKTKQICCYIGEPYRVQGSLRELEIALQKEKEGGDGAFVDTIIMYEILSEIKEIAARGGISCTCGGKGCAVEVNGRTVDLVCPACGGRLRLPAATNEDLDRLCCQYTLTIRGGR